MALSWQTDYALRTLMLLAQKAGRSTVGEVAEFFGISREHLAKAVQRLARLGYVRSLRGVGGGIELARTPQQIAIGQVVRDFEGSMQLLDCVDIDDICVIQPVCKLRHVLAEAARRQQEYLDAVTLADVIVVRDVPEMVELTHVSQARKGKGKS